MDNNIKGSDDPIRNPFVALCEYASNNNWCWNLYCTTCGHGSFRVAFSKLIHGQDPDSESFWPNGKENHSLLKELDSFSDFWRDATTANQIELATLAAQARLSDIQAVAKFPGWLGYIGLLFHHCPNLNARLILSNSFFSQFIALVKDESVREYLQNKHANQALLNIEDLSVIENGLIKK